MPAVVVSTKVSRPAEDVFAYATDPSRFHEWQQGLISGHLEAAGEASVGDRRTMVRRIGFADRASTSEVVHVDPPRSWQIRGIDGLIRAIVEVTVAPLTADRAWLTISVDFEGPASGPFSSHSSSAVRHARRCSSTWRRRRLTSRAEAASRARRRK